MEHADYLSRLNTLTQQTKTIRPSRKDATYIMVIVYNEEGKIYMSLRTHRAKVMPNQLQVPGGKVEKGETSVEAAERELAEETGITNVILKYWGTDERYNTDIYLYQKGPSEEMYHMEPTKNGS